MRNEASSTIPRGRETDGAFTDDIRYAGVAEPTAASARLAFSFGPFHVLAAQRLLLKGHTPVRLGSRALEILIALVERPAELLTKRELRARAWPDTVVEDGNLKVQVAALRRALGDGRGGNRYLSTISGRGYRFVAPVTRREESAILSAPPALEPARDARHDLRPGSHGWSAT